MKRSALIISLLEVVAAALLYLIGVRAVLVFGAVLFALAVLAFLLRRRLAVDFRSIVVLLSAVLCCVLFAVFGLRAERTASSVDGQSGTVLCTVVEEPEYNDGYTVLEVESSKNRTENSGICGKLRFLVWVDERQEAASADVGDILSVNVSFQRIDDEYRKYYYHRGIYALAHCYSAEIVGERFVAAKPFVELRRYIRGTLSTCFDGDTEALMNGVMLGDNSDMSDRLYADFKICGLNHVTAVSGLHIGVICSMFMSLFSAFLSRRKAALLSIVPLIVVVAVTGFSPSAVRAGIMCIITFAGTAFMKKPDPLNSLGVAVALMLLYNPYYISSVSFQLSCSATAGVVIASPYGAALADKLFGNIKRRAVRKVLKGALQSFCLSVGATVFTIPFQMINFGFISIIAPIASVLVCIAVTYALMLGVAGIIINAIPFVGIAAAVPFWAAGVLVDYMAAVASLLAEIPFSYIPIGDELTMLWLALVLALLAVWFLLDRVGGKRTVSLMASALLVIALASNSLFSRSRVEIAVIDLGKTYCTAVTYGKSCVLIGCGDDRDDYYSIESYIKLKGIYSIKAVVLTRESGSEEVLYELLSKNPPEMLYLTEPAESEPGIRTEVLTVGETVELPVNTTLMTHKSGGGYIFELNTLDRSVAISGGAGFEDIDVGSFDIVITDTELPVGEQKGITVIKGGLPDYEGSDFSGEILFAPRSDVTFTIRKGKEVAFDAE